MRTTMLVSAVVLMLLLGVGAVMGSFGSSGHTQRGGASTTTIEPLKLHQYNNAHELPDQQISDLF